VVKKISSFKPLKFKPLNVQTQHCRHIFNKKEKEGVAFLKIASIFAAQLSKNGLTQ
jgi:hypothetical protein